MSRRKPNPNMVDFIDGVVRLWCPNEHEIGWIVVHRTNRTRFVLANGIFIGTLDDPKIRVRCLTCEEAGRHLDLQASSSRLKALALKNLDEGQNADEDVVLGG